MRFPAAVFFLLVGAAAVADATEQALHELKNSKETAERHAARGGAVAAEIQRLPEHPWAGKYYEGDGTAVNRQLVIAPASGFTFDWHGCLGLYDRNFGSMRKEDGQLHLTFDLENQKSGLSGLEPVLLPIQWGERTYLVGSDKIVDFCNAVNSGMEPRKEMHGMFFLKVGDEKTTAAGKPTIPAQFEPYLLERPTTASIASIDGATTRPSIIDFHFIDTTVTLTSGRAAGLLPGMELGTIEPRRVVGTATVKETYDTTSSAVMTHTTDNGTTPAVGWVMSTGWLKRN